MENSKSFTPAVRRVTNEQKMKIQQVMTDIRHQLKNVYLSKNGKLCQIKLNEDTDVNVTFLSIKSLYGRGKKYDPNHVAQRRDKQHTRQKQLNILISALSEERIGNIILKKTNDNRYEIIDGRQRTSIIYNFLKGKPKDQKKDESYLTLSGKHAKDFWKLFLNDDFLYYEKLDDKDKTICNQILSKIENGSFPTVNFLTLPSIIQQHILNFFNLNAIVVKPTVSYLENNEEVSKEDLNEEEVNDAIIRKFIDINDSSAAINNEDILWATGADPILQSRKYLETLPSLFQLLSYNLREKLIGTIYVLDDTKEARKLATLLGRSQMIYQKVLNWGSSELKLRTLALETEDTKFTDKTKETWKFLSESLENYIFKQTYIERESEKNLQVPDEFKEGRRDVLVLMFLLSMMYLSDYILKKNSKDPFWMAKEKLLVDGIATRKFFKWVENIMIYLTLGKLANIDHEEWDRKDLPIFKYNLSQEFYSTEIFEDVEIGVLMKKIKDLNQHQEGLSKDSETTLRSLIKYCETKI
jgi:hypothetical protein